MPLPVCSRQAEAVIIAHIVKLRRLVAEGNSPENLRGQKAARGDYPRCGTALGAVGAEDGVAVVAAALRDSASDILDSELAVRLILPLRMPEARAVDSEELVRVISPASNFLPPLDSELAVRESLPMAARRGVLTPPLAASFVESLMLSSKAVRPLSEVPLLPRLTSSLADLPWRLFSGDPSSSGSHQLPCALIHLRLMSCDFSTS